MKSFLYTSFRAIIFCSYIFLIVLLSAGHQGFILGEEEIPLGNGVRTIYLIRHGDYDHEDNREPDVGKGLIPLGIAQARLVSARLLSLPIKITSLHSSTMTRARQTALIINQDFPHLQLLQSKLLRECTPPTWRKDISDEVPPPVLLKCKTTLDEAFSIYFTPSPLIDQHDIIVCHGNVIRYFVTKVLKINSMSWLGMIISNCSITMIKIYADGSKKLLSFNDVGHIPPNMQTATGYIYNTGDLTVPEEKKPDNQ